MVSLADDTPFSLFQVRWFPANIQMMQSNQTILVLGAEGLGRTVAQAAHRPALYARLAGAEEGSVVTPALAARMLRAEGLHDRVFVNQADDWERWADAVRALAAELDCPVAAGSLRRGVWRRVQ